MYFPEGANLFKRNCVTCPSGGPQCSACPSGQVCTLTVQTCEKCPEARCVSDGKSGHISGKSAGAIAGGVVGGLVGLALIAGLVLWYKFRHRRKRHLQFMKEAQLEYESPPQSPVERPTSVDHRPPSITSTYGVNSHRSNVIPIMLPFNSADGSMSQVGEGSRRNTAYSNAPFGRRITSGANGGSQPVLRDSIGFSEYSVDSDSTSTNNHGLRSYDVAVQGMPSLVDLNRARRIPILQPQLGAISENVAYQAPLGEARSEIDSESNLSSKVPSQSSKRRSIMSMRSADAALPELPRSQANSCFDDSEALPGQDLPRSRYSRASSNEYDANLPDEARLYLGNNLFQ